MRDALPAPRAHAAPAWMLAMIGELLTPAQAGEAVAAWPADLPLGVPAGRVRDSLISPSRVDATWQDLVRGWGIPQA